MTAHDTLIEAFTPTLVTSPPSLPVERRSERLTYQQYAALVLQREAARAAQVRL